jgi:hypothetical protein
MRFTLVAGRGEGQKTLMISYPIDTALYKLMGDCLRC